MPQFWCLLLTGVAGGALLAFGEFAAAAVLAAWAVWECHRGLSKSREDANAHGLVLVLVEFFLLAGLVYYYRQSLLLECLALFALLGAFIEAHVQAVLATPAHTRRVIDRLRLISVAAWFATVTEWFMEGADPVLGHPVAVPLVAGLVLCSALSHYGSIRLLGRFLLAARRRRRAWQRLTLVKPRLAV